MPEEQIRMLREQVEALNKQLHDLGISLKGSETLSIVGMYQRLKEVEACTNRCEQLIHEFKDELEEDFKTELKEHRKAQEQQMNIMFDRIDKNSTALSSALMEIHFWSRILSIFRTENFWKLLAGVISAITFSKTFYWIIDALRSLWNNLTN